MAVGRWDGTVRALRTQWLQRDLLGEERFHIYCRFGFEQRGIGCVYKSASEQMNLVVLRLFRSSLARPLETTTRQLSGADDLNAHSLRILDVEPRIEVVFRSGPERLQLPGYRILVELL